ncbi:uncharacterized protein LOC130719799 [Lotus japonicus]|uniref:uncharacterized protein LOC130719799 n=1 Tax=Lotus japonicus TaxID=34305 RepID=UPI00258432AC|nr:uncharacterized protein LOC130719799 [Lotus japonicus]
MGKGGASKKNVGSFQCTTCKEWYETLEELESYGGNAFASEAEALLLGLKLVWDRGYREVTVKVDCAELLQSIENGDSGRFFPVIIEIKQLRDRAWNISIERVRRECNAPADYLAKLGARSPGVNFSFLDKPPWEVETLVLRDRVFAR